MNVGYIKKETIPSGMYDKIKYFLGRVTTYNFEQGCIFKIPITDKEKSMDKIILNLFKQIYKYKIDALVFSDTMINMDVMFYKKIVDKAQKSGKRILNGKKLMKYMDFDIFEYILNVQNLEMNQEDIFFLIKKDDNLDLQFLSKFIEKCKTVNIVTNDIERFKKVQDTVYEKENILISVSNNKNKALKRAKYIFNVNMDKKDIEKFKINRDAIIVNFGENIKYNVNSFNGINVNYIQIDVPDEYIEQYEALCLVKEFDVVKLYESILMKKIEVEKKRMVMMSKSDLDKIKNLATDIIKKDNIKVIGLIGNNGRIDEKEMIRKCKILYENAK